MKKTIRVGVSIAILTSLILVGMFITGYMGGQKIVPLVGLSIFLLGGLMILQKEFGFRMIPASAEKSLALLKSLGVTLLIGVFAYALYRAASWVGEVQEIRNSEVREARRVEAENTIPYGLSKHIAPVGEWSDWKILPAGSTACSIFNPGGIPLLVKTEQRVIRLENSGQLWDGGITSKLRFQSGTNRPTEAWVEIK